MAEDPRDRLIRYLQDAHAAEVGIASTLETFINDVNDPTVRSAFQQHLDVTRSQAQRLENRLEALGSGTSGGKSFMNSMMAKLSDVMDAGHDTYDKTTMDLVKAFGTEYLEIGMYTSLIAYAQALGDQETASLAQQIMAEEKQAADTVYPMISQAAASALNATSAQREPAAV